MKRHRQSGQALTEVLVVCLALLPLFVALPLLARFQDIRLATIAASRSAAFDCTVRFERCAQSAAQGPMADDLRRRHFARHDRDVLSLDAMALEPPIEERNRFWVDRRGQPLLASPADVALAITASSSDALDGALADGARRTSRAGGVVDAISDLAGPGAFGLEVSEGLLTARVRARIGAGYSLADWLRRPESLALALTGKTVVLTDAWNATGVDGGESRSVRSRVDEGRRLPTLGDGHNLVQAATGLALPGLPTALAQAEPEDLLDALYLPARELISGPLLRPIQPRGRLFRYHEVDLDLVPPDRLAEAP